MLYFFDSHGGLWACCLSTHPGAEAFGPRGCARAIGADELATLGLWAEGCTPWRAAQNQDLLEIAEDLGFDTLIPRDEAQELYWEAVYHGMLQA